MCRLILAVNTYLIQGNFSFFRRHLDRKATVVRAPRTVSFCHTMSFCDCQVIVSTLLEFALYTLKLIQLLICTHAHTHLQYLWHIGFRRPGETSLTSELC